MLAECELVYCIYLTRIYLVCLEKSWCAYFEVAINAEMLKKVLRVFCIP